MRGLVDLLHRTVFHSLDLVSIILRRLKEWRGQEASSEGKVYGRLAA